MANHPNRGAGSRAANPAPEAIRAAREAVGLTQTQAADFVHATCRRWQEWEAGTYRMHPGLFELFRLKTTGPMPAAPCAGRAPLAGLESLRSGLDKVGAALEEYRTASAVLQGSPGDISDLQYVRIERTRREYLDACQVFYGYARQAVEQAKQKAIYQPSSLGMLPAVFAQVTRCLDGHDFALETLELYRQDAAADRGYMLRLRGFLQGLQAGGVLSIEDYCEVDALLEPIANAAS